MRNTPPSGGRRLSGQGSRQEPRSLQSSSRVRLTRLPAPARLAMSRPSPSAPCHAANGAVALGQVGPYGQCESLTRNAMASPGRPPGTFLKSRGSGSWAVCVLAGKVQDSSGTFPVWLVRLPSWNMRPGRANVQCTVPLPQRPPPKHSNNPPAVATLNDPPPRPRGRGSSEQRELFCVCELENTDIHTNTHITCV